MQKPLFQQVEFYTSAAQLSDLPPDKGKEIAIVGRSNAGKSSIINRLTNNKKLAKISKTPGRTQLINYFKFQDDRYLVDLPGYGYAKVSKQIKKHWDKTLDAYLTRRRSLAGVILVMDIRHPLTEFDQQMIAWAQASHLELHALLNKADKLKYGAQKKTMLSVESKLNIQTEAPLSCQLFSAETGIGLEQLQDWLIGILDLEA